MRHEELHLIDQNSAIAQDEVLPETGHVGGIQQAHPRLLGRPIALAVVAGLACSDDVHPVVPAVLRHGDDVLARQVVFREMLPAIRTQVPITREQLAVGQRGAQLEWIDGRHALGPDDGVDRDDRLPSCDGVVSAVEHGNLCTDLPADIVGSIVQHGFLQADP